MTIAVTGCRGRSGGLGGARRRKAYRPRGILRGRRVAMPCARGWHGLLGSRGMAPAGLAFRARNRQRATGPLSPAGSHAFLVAPSEQVTMKCFTL
jgi:hypothetical protein